MIDVTSFWSFSVKLRESGAYSTNALYAIESVGPRKKLGESQNSTILPSYIIFHVTPSPGAFYTSFGEAIPFFMFILHAV
jgi:hypothetical protein